MGEPLKDPHDALAGQGEVHFDGHAFARTLIEDRERPEHAAIAERVAHEVHAPALIGLARTRQRDAGHHGPPLPLPAPDLQAFFLVDPLHPLVVDPLAEWADLAPQHPTQLAVAPAPVLRGQRVEAGPQGRVGRPA